MGSKDQVWRPVGCLTAGATRGITKHLQFRVGRGCQQPILIPHGVQPVQIDLLFLQDTGKLLHDPLFEQGRKLAGRDVFLAKFVQNEHLATNKLTNNGGRVAGKVHADQQGPLRAVLQRHLGHMDLR